MDWQISYDKEVEIKLLPHLKKFILKFYKQSEPVRVDFDMSIASVFDSVLRRKNIYRKDRDRYTAPLRFLLNKRLSELSLEHKYLVQFNVEFDRIFKDNLNQWVLAQANVGVSDSQAVRDFLDYYNIREDELSFDTARSMHRRYKTDYFRRKRQSA